MDVKFKFKNLRDFDVIVGQNSPFLTDFARGPYSSASTASRGVSRVVGCMSSRRLVLRCAVAAVIACIKFMMSTLSLLLASRSRNY